jgi:CRISPR/Cas system CSM-associated protein Csm2 small subunit
MTLQELTQKQKEIIDHIYHYRFLSSFHIQQLLKNKDRSQINKWLNYLTENNYLYREISTKLKENTKPAIYYINKNGIRYLRIYKNVDSNLVQNLYYESKRKYTFRTHCLSLADLICNLQNHARSQNKTAKIYTRVDYANAEDSEDDSLYLLYKLSPDAYYTYNGSGIAKACFIEVIDEQIKPSDLQRKIAKYIKAREDGEEEALGLERFPLIACVLPNQKKLSELKRIIKRTKAKYIDDEPDLEIRFNLTLISDIQTKSIAEAIWEKA